jgi:MFS family permease
MLQTEKKKLFYGYVIALSSFFVLMIVWGAQYTFGVFFKPVLTDLAWTRAVISGAYSLNMVMIGVFGVVAGRLSDRFGPRIVVTVCGSFMGVSYLLMSQISSVWQIYVFYGVLASIGTAGSWIPLLSTVARWFVRRRGLITGLVASGIGIGTIIMPPLSNLLISSYGWRVSYAVIGVISLVMVVVAAQFLKHSPGQMNCLPDGDREVRPNEHNRKLRANGFILQKAARTRQFWMLCAVYFGLGICLYTVMVHIVPDATDTGISAAGAATILSFVGGTSILSKIGMGNAIDRFGNKPVAILVSVLMLGSFVWLQFASGLWMFYVFAFIFALGYGGFAAFQSPFAAEYFGLKEHGMIFGWLMSAVYMGGAVGPLVAGLIFDTTGKYNLVFMTCAVISVISLVVAWGVKPLRDRTPA